MDRFGRTWQLFQESYAVLTADVEILLFPVMSGVSLLLVAASFFFPLYVSGAFRALRGVRPDHWGWDVYAVMFAWYFCNFFVGIFFNGALAACANIRLQGGDPTVRDGLAAAFGRIGRIAAWALVASTVGMFLSSIRDRRNWLLNILGASLSLAWALITYLIVPVILFEDRGVYDSIYRSEELFRKHWGEQVAGSLGFGLLGFLWCLPALGLAALGWMYDPALGIIMGAVYVLIVSVVFSAVRGVFTVALYRYAVSGEAPSGFTASAIDEALGGQKRRARPDDLWREY